MRCKEQSFVTQGLTWLLPIVLLYSFNLQFKDQQCCIVPHRSPHYTMFPTYFLLSQTFYHHV